jgi:hypothetical protein
MTYLIEARHSPSECVQAMDEALARGPRFLAQFDWGCVAGEHTGWATVQAENESQAREMVPSVVRSKARIVRVDKVTPDHINAMLYMPPEPEGPADTPDPYEVVLASMEEDETDEDMWARPEAWVTP